MASEATTVGRVAGGALEALPESKSASRLIAERIIAAIESGAYAIDSKLPSEQELARELGVSRPSIREAISALQFVGYVESRRGSGTVVVANRPLIRWDDDQGPLQTKAQALELLEARLAIEPIAMRTAACDPEPRAVATTARVLEGMRLALYERGISAPTDLTFHLSIIRACRNRILASQCTNLLQRMSGAIWREIRESTWEGSELPRTWFKQHSEVFDAISERQADRAEKATRLHIASVLRTVLAWEASSGGGDERDPDAARSAQRIAEVFPDLRL